MPRPTRGPYLFLRNRASGPMWVIRDRQREVVTGCGKDERSRAEEILAAYLLKKHRPGRSGDLGSILVADVVAFYAERHAPKTSDGGAWLGFMLTPILEWWGTKSLADINLTTCEAYALARLKAGVGVSTVRHELSALRAAINFSHRDTPLPAVPVVTMPKAPKPERDYWLTRSEVAARLCKIRRDPKRQHVVRMILIGVYSGTRPGAILGLRWTRTKDSGWVDIEGGVMHRSGPGQPQTKKRQPPCRIHDRLMPWFRRWRAADREAGVDHVIHFEGRPVRKLRRSWASISEGRDAPHVLRHTAATWQMLSGTDPYEAARYLGMSYEILWSVYGHHHPAFQAGAASASGRRPHNQPINDATERKQTGNKSKR